MIQFDSLQAFLVMEGHGVHVWSAYLVSLALMGWMLVSPRLRRRQLLKLIKRQQQRERLLQQQNGE